MLTIISASKFFIYLPFVEPDPAVEPGLVIPGPFPPPELQPIVGREPFPEAEASLPII